MANRAARGPRAAGLNSGPADPSVEPSGVAFQVTLLGGFALSAAGTRLSTETWQPRARMLFALIACAPVLRRSRDEIIDSLWPDATPEAGASNLRYTVHLLRRLLSGFDPSPVLVQAGWVGLNPIHDWQVDLHQFEAAAAQGSDQASMREAAALYGGELLPEYRYEDWAAPRRERAQRSWREIMLRLAALHSESDNLPAAVDLLERLHEADPLDEEAVQQLLTALIGLHRYTEALRIYGAFAGRLREELDVEPEPETAALAAELRLQRGLAPAEPVAPAVVPAPSREFHPAYPLPRPGRLLGREHEMQHINALLDRVEAGESTRMLLLAAEAGMGKTRLLAEAAAVARARGMLVLAGGCYEEEGRLPWGPIHDALLDYLRAQPETGLTTQLGDLLPALAEIVPELRTRLDVPRTVGVADTDAQRLRLFSTLAQTVARIAAHQPLVFILDDLQWADAVTVQVLHFLLRQPGLERVLVLAAFRSDEVPADTPLGALVLKARTGEDEAVLTVPALSDADIARLLEDRLAGPCAPSLVENIHGRSAGNPFFAVQIARLLQQEGHLHRDSGHWGLAGGTTIDLPPAVRETVSRRLRHIGVDVRAVLNLGAILGREFAYPPLELLSERAEDELFEHLDQAQEAGLIRESADGYAFVHPLLWEVVYGRIPDQRRRRLHARAGSALARTYGSNDGDHAAQLAWHFIEAGDREPALHYSVLAARRAEAGVAHAEAERFFRQAVALADALGDQDAMAGALEGVGRVLRAVSRLEEAADALQEAARIENSLGDLDAEGRIVAQLTLVWYFLGARDPEKITFVRNLVRRLEARDGDRPSEALAQLSTALPRLLDQTPEEELKAATHAAELGRLTGDTLVEAAGRLRQGTALNELRRYEEALTTLDEAIRLAGAGGDLFTLAAANQFARRAVMRLRSGLHGIPYAMSAFEAAEKRGGLEQMLGILDGSFQTAFDVGEWALAESFVIRAIALYRALRGSVTSAWPWLHLARLNIHRGEWTATEEYLDEVRRMDQRVVSALARRELTHMEALHAMMAGNVSEAREHIRRLPLGWDLEGLLELVTYVQVLALADDPEAETLGRRVTQAMQMHDHPLDRSTATYALGLALRRRGKGEEAETLLRQVEDFGHAYPAPYLRGQALLELAELARSRGDIAAARESLTTAFSLFESLGAKPAMKQTRTALDSISGVGQDSSAPHF